MSSTRFSRSVERETSHVLYSRTGRSATWLSWTAVPNRSRVGGTKVSFTPSGPAVGDELPRPAFSSSSSDATMIRSASGRSATLGSPPAVAARDDHGHVDVGEELELTARCVRERPVSDDHRALRRGHQPPDPARDAAKRERDGGRGEPGPQHARERHRRAGQGYDDHSGGNRRRERPGHEHWSLVDRQVPERPVVAVVEPVQLGEHDPDRNGQQHDGEVEVRAAHDDRRPDQRRRDIGDRQHSASECIARPGGRGSVELPSPERHGRGPRSTICSGLLKARSGS